MKASEARNISNNAPNVIRFNEINEIYNLISKRAEKGEYNLTTDILLNSTIEALEKEGYLVTCFNGGTYIAW